MIAVENGDSVPVFWQSDYLIKLLVIDCGGHARALEALHSAIDNKKVAQVGVENIAAYSAGARQPLLRGDQIGVG